MVIADGGSCICLHYCLFSLHSETKPSPFTSFLRISSHIALIQGSEAIAFAFKGDLNGGV